MKRFASFLCTLVFATHTFAKDKPVVTIQVVDTAASQRQWSYTTPGSASRSDTYCNGNATATNLGGGMTTANGTTNCTTTTRPGSAPVTHTRNIAQEHVHVVMPDGSRVTLWCQAGFRHCACLQPGSYTAELSRNVVWMHAHDLEGKDHKIKYDAVGGW